MQKKSYASLEEIKRKLERYCVYQERSHKEIEQKLFDYHLIPEAKAAVICHLIEHDFLNEQRFAKSFVRGKFRIKKWGKNRIINELKFKDVSVYNINAALKEIDNQEYLSTLYELAFKKRQTITESNHFKVKKKIFDYLVYRGYELDLIYQTIDRVLNE